MARPQTRAGGAAVRPRRALSMRELAGVLGLAPHMYREVLAWLEALGAPLLYGGHGQSILIREDDLAGYRERLQELATQYLERTAAKTA